MGKAFIEFPINIYIYIYTYNRIRGSVALYPASEHILNEDASKYNLETSFELAHRYSAPIHLVICIPAHIDSRCSRFEAAAHVAADSERASDVIILAMEACHNAYFSQMQQVV
jgi:hypothetical protein